MPYVPAPQRSYHAAVRAATTANISLSGAQTIDTVSVVAGDRVLVKNQSTGSQNGIYVASASTWSRATDASYSLQMGPQHAVRVAEGTQAGTEWYCMNTGTITLGTTALTYSNAVNKKIRASHGFSLSGSVSTATLPGLWVSLASGETKQLVKATYSCGSGSGTVSVLRATGANSSTASGATGFTSLSVTTTDTSVTPSAITLADGDYLTVQITASTMTDMRVTLFVESSV